MLRSIQEDYLKSGRDPLDRQHHQADPGHDQRASDPAGGSEADLVENVRFAFGRDTNCHPYPGCVLA